MSFVSSVDLYPLKDLTDEAKVSHSGHPNGFLLLCS